MTDFYRWDVYLFDPRTRKECDDIKPFGHIYAYNISIRVRSMTYDVFLQVFQDSLFVILIRADGISPNAAT